MHGGPAIHYAASFPYPAYLSAKAQEAIRKPRQVRSNAMRPLCTLTFKLPAGCIHLQAVVVKSFLGGEGEWQRLEMHSSVEWQVIGLFAAMYIPAGKDSSPFSLAKVSRSRSLIGRR